MDNQQKYEAPMTNVYVSPVLTIKVSIILLLIPIIQLGFHYYVSSMILGFLVILSIVKFHYATRIIPVLVLTLFLMLVPSIYYLDGSNFEYNMLKVFREFICFSVIFYYLSLTRLNINNNKAYEYPITIVLCLIIIMQFIFVVFQFIKLKNGVGIYLPVEWYIQNANTIPDELDLKWSKIRPSGTFGEPSYLGFISVSLLLIVTNYINSKNIQIILVIVLLMTVLLANTMAGILSMLVLITLIFWFKSKSDIRHRMVIVSTIFVFITVLLGSGYTDIISRMSNITDKSAELSGYLRILMPIKATALVFTESPIGVPTSELGRILLNSHYINYTGGAFSNGFFNLLVNYGVFGLFIIFVIYYQARRNIYILVYLFLASMFNGSIFSFDKAVVISLTLLLITAAQQNKINSKQ